MAHHFSQSLLYICSITRKLFLLIANSPDLSPNLQILLHACPRSDWHPGLLSCPPTNLSPGWMISPSAQASSQPPEVFFYPMPKMHSMFNSYWFSLPQICFIQPHLHLSLDCYGIHLVSIPPPPHSSLPIYFGWKGCCKDSPVSWDRLNFGVKQNGFMSLLLYSLTTGHLT